MNIEQMKRIINRTMDTNKILTDKGDAKHAINFVGAAGLGKTNSVMQVAEERGCQCISLVLSQLEEVGDLTGLPITLYKVISPEGKETEVADKLVPSLIQAGYTLCTNCAPITSNAKPSWVPEDNGQECILFLDDFTRCGRQFLQAIMQLLQFGSFATWSLPKYCTIILSSNPEGGLYEVADMDPALKSRMINFAVDFDVKIWSKWADSKKKPSSLINFALWKPDIFDDPNHIINARSYTMFMDALTGYQLDKSDLSDVILFASGIFGENQGITRELQLFLDMRLDRLPEAEEIIKGSWKEVEKKLSDILYEGDNYRTDIATLLVIRLNNYLSEYFNEKNTKNKGSIIEKRLIELLDTKKPLLQENGLLEIVQTILVKYSQKCPNLLMNPKVRSKIIM